MLITNAETHYQKMIITFGKINKPFQVLFDKHYWKQTHIPTHTQKQINKQTNKQLEVVDDSDEKCNLNANQPKNSIPKSSETQQPLRETQSQPILEHIDQSIPQSYDNNNDINPEFKDLLEYDNGNITNDDIDSPYEMNQQNMHNMAETKTSNLGLFFVLCVFAFLRFCVCLKKIKTTKHCEFTEDIIQTHSKDQAPITQHTPIIFRMMCLKQKKIWETQILPIVYQTHRRNNIIHKRVVMLEIVQQYCLRQKEIV